MTDSDAKLLGFMMAVPEFPDDLGVNRLLMKTMPSEVRVAIERWMDATFEAAEAAQHVFDLEVALEQFDVDRKFEEVVTFGWDTGST